ncbi:MAG TPA: alpha/beta hydrolase [Flavisolibacter sp.]|nr:alpha/beta hydrolase [Flavisolibacter sp.]
MAVYKLYDQASLDSQFNNRQHVPDYADYLNRWEWLSRETERKLLVIKDIPYGNLPGEQLDIYPSPQPRSKTFVFIHGGYWQMLNKAMFHFIAKGLHPYGITTVLLTYPLAPEVSIDQIVLSCRKAIKWLYNNASSFDVDPNQMYVAGHSAGGHLAAMLVATDWKRFDSDLPPNMLKGACLISGLFDLVPIHLSYLNKTLNMDRETAIRNSPVRLEPLNDCPVIVAVGEAETTEFNDQSQVLYACWKDKGKNIQFLQLPQQNHYSIVEAVVDQNAALHKTICRLMEVYT